MLDILKRKPRCPACGARVREGALLCPTCGQQLAVTRQSEQCPACGARILANEDTCPICGAHHQVEAPRSTVTFWTVLAGAFVLAAFAGVIWLIKPWSEIRTAAEGTL